MFRPFNHSAAVRLAAVAGLLAVGFVVGSRWPFQARLPRAHAIAAATQETFAVCTTPMDGNTEAVFVLDFETGDLAGGVLNSNTGKFTSAYRHNVLNDLGFKPGQVKSPRFLLVPGTASFSGNAGNRMARSVLYVTDASTGVTAAYGISWAPQQATAAGPVMGEIRPLDVLRPRGGAPAAP